MKQKLYISGIINAMVILLGAIFKIEHLPGAGILLTIGISSMVLIFLPLALLNNYRSQEGEKSALLYFTIFFTCLVVFTAMLFKIQHWPYSGIALLIALPFPYLVFLPVYLVVTSRNSRYNIYHTVFVLLLLAINSVFSALLALNVSNERIADSYRISENFNKVEVSLNGTSQSGKEEISLSVGNILKTIDEYQAVILAREGISEEQWSANPYLLNNPDSRVEAYIALEEAGVIMPEKNKLEDELRDLITTLKSDPQLSNLAGPLVSIMGLAPAAKNYFYPLATEFSDKYLAWSLIWLDSLETNLKLIRMAVL